MASRLRAVAFDCHGTLVDVSDSDYVLTFDEICQRQRLPCAGQRLWETWLTLWLRLGADGSTAVAKVEDDLFLAGPLSGEPPSFVPNREGWPRHFAVCFRELGLAGGDPQAAYRHLRDRLAGAPAHRDAGPALDRLRGRFPLALLSNADDDFLLPCLERNALVLDVILSSERIGVHKPHELAFRRLAEALGLGVGEVLYVGDSPFTDVLGARNAGMPVVWLNRRDAPRPDRIPPPHAEIASLTELPEVLDALADRGWSGSHDKGPEAAR